MRMVTFSLTSAPSMICALEAPSSNTGKYTCKATWSSPDLRMHNQIDHVTVSKKWKKTLFDVKVMRGVVIDSDHHLVIGTFRMKLAAKRIVGGSGRKRFNTAKLMDMGVHKEVTVTLRNKFEVLADVDEDGQDVDRMWQHCKSIFRVPAKKCWDTRTQQERNGSVKIH